MIATRKITENAAKAVNVKLEKSNSDRPNYYITFDENAKYPITKSFFEELTELCQTNLDSFQDYLNTIVKIQPNLISSKQ